MKYRAEILLGGILILSAFLNFWNVWNQGFSNSYYAAAVRSMLENPGIAFFNSFDAAGFVTVDKPPVGLWVQAASAAIFGYSGWALVLPQALAGVGSVALVYAIVSRSFGKSTGLVSAFALAVTPIFVAVSRSMTMDGILIFILLLALWVALRAAREQSLALLLLSVALIGVGFNTKMIQAFIAVPAVLGIYLAGIRHKTWEKQALHLGLALTVLAVISLSWAVTVDLTPADERPYIGGSGDNTVLGLIIEYNGLHRLESGGTGGSGSLAGSGGSSGPGTSQDSRTPVSSTGNTMQNRTADRPATGDPVPSGTVAPDDQQDQDGRIQTARANGPSGSSKSQAPSGGRTGGSGGMDNSGTPGLFRLFNSDLAGQISWLLPFALIGLLAWYRRPATLSLKGLEDAGLFSERGLVILAAGLWLLPGLAYFSFTTGFWHTYYIATIAPPLAILVGTGALGLYRTYCSGGTRGWLLVAAVAATGLIQLLILSYSQPWSDMLMMILAAGIIVMCALLAFYKIRRIPVTATHCRAIAAAAIAILFLATTVWAFTPLVYGNGSRLPVAGPDQGRGGGSTGNAISGSDSGISPLAGYLLSHRTGETWILAVSSSKSASDLIIETGEPVMALGGYSGSDQILSVDSLRDLIEEGKIRYFLGSQSGGGGRGNLEIFTWVSEHCTAIPSAEYSRGSADPSDRTDQSLFGNTSLQAFQGSGAVSSRDTPGTGDTGSLYDCAGYTGQGST